jgi:Fe-S oxidoreductase
MDQHVLRAFEARCTQEEPPACQTMCPLHVEARAFIRLMADGKTGDARKVLDRSMPLSCLTGLLCDGSCMPHCRRAEVDSGVNMPLLERACVILTKSSRPLALPATGKAIAVAGAGLSSLVLAFELGKKGHAVTVFHTTPIGGRIPALPEENPEQGWNGPLREAIEQLTAVRVAFAQMEEFSPAVLKNMLDGHLALYIGFDDESANPARFGLGNSIVPLTQETADPKIFAGGTASGSSPSFIHEAADGKRAAGSITRLLQGVHPASAREREALYPSLLHTDISSVPPSPPVSPADPAAPSQEEAMAEAARCIQCECLECVKNCVYLARYKAYPKRYAREIYNNLSIVHGVRRANIQINSCAECGLCAVVCPNRVDMGEFCAAARRKMIQARRMPPSAHEFALEDMAYSNSPDIAFFRHQPGHTASSRALFPGCQLPASLPDQTGRLYAHLCEHLPGGVGFLFHCCGAPARWSGREALTSSAASSVRALWVEAGKPELLTACASCAAFFAVELPEIPFRSLWEVLAALPLPASAVKADFPLALHDPCAVRHIPVVRDSVRGIIRSLGQDVEELPLGREHTRCCGYGGLADAANQDMGEAYAQSRAGDTQNTLLAYCIMCRDRLRAVGKPSVHLLDLLFASLSPDLAAVRPAPGISDRQEARLAFRRRLLQSLWHETPARSSPMDALILRIDDAVARKLETRRILHTDIKAVLLHAQEHGAQFFNAETGHCLTSFRPQQVSFWVEFTRNPDGSHTIHDAYCHRMVVPGVPGEGAPTAVILEGHDPQGGRV